MKNLTLPAKVTGASQLPFRPFPFKINLIQNSNLQNEISSTIVDIYRSTHIWIRLYRYESNQGIKISSFFLSLGSTISINGAI